MKKKKTKTAPGKPARKPVKKAAKKSRKVSPIPRGYHTVTPYLVHRNTGNALEFYKKAFGGKEIMRMAGPDGRIAHAEIQIGDSRVMLGDEMPEMGAQSAESVGGTPVHIFLYLKDVDATFAQATAAGAKVEMPPMDMFWGDRYAKVVDPFGHKWNMATHKEDLTPKEMARRGAEAAAKPQG